MHYINTSYIPGYRGKKTPKKHVTEAIQQMNLLTLQFRQVHLMCKAIIKACILSVGLCNLLQYVNPWWIWRILVASRVPLNGDIATSGCRQTTLNAFSLSKLQSGWWITIYSHFYFPKIWKCEPLGCVCSSVVKYLSVKSYIACF